MSARKKFKIQRSLGIRPTRKGSISSSMLTHSLRVDGSYAYLDPYNVTDKVTLNGRSRNQGYFRTEYVSNRLGIVANIRGNFYGRYLIDASSGEHEQAYALWNLYASKDISRGVQAYGSINNLGNSRDSLLSQTTPTYDRSDYGRMFRVGLRYTFPHE